MSASLFPWLRLLHILFAALWLGAAAFLTLILLPTLRQLGPGGHAMLQALTRRGLHRFMGASAGLAVLSGLGLYWALTAGFNPAAMDSPAGRMFGLGGVAGVLAAIIGGAVIGRTLTRMEALISAGAPRDGEMAVLQRRVATASRTALALLVFALVMMALGHGT